MQRREATIESYSRKRKEESRFDEKYGIEYNIAASTSSDFGNVSKGEAFAERREARKAALVQGDAVRDEAAWTSVLSGAEGHARNPPGQRVRRHLQDAWPRGLS